MKVGQPGDWIGELFENGPNDRQIETWKNIWWRICLMHIPPRDSRFDYEREMGSQLVESVLEHRSLNVKKTKAGDGQRLLFVFPERYMTTQEEYYFIPMLRKHPDVVDMKLNIIDVVTKSALIIGNFIKDDIRIVKPEGAELMGISQATSDAMKKANV